MLIGLTGRARSGKDTVFGFIQEEFPYAKREAFADRLKLSAARMFYPDCNLQQALQWADYIKRDNDNNLVSMNLEHESGVDRVEVSGRTLLQRYGTEAHRNVFDTDFWVNAVLPLTMDHTDELIVVTDVRFDNEAQRVRDLKGEVWEITRPSLKIVESAHASEMPVDPKFVDQQILNDSTLFNLRHVVRMALNPVGQT